MKTINCQVEEAGYFYVGHFNYGYLQILSGGAGIKITPNKCNKLFELLYYVFGVDSEDGVFFEKIKGKYFRLKVDDKFKILAIGHIVNDYFIDIKELQGEE